MTSQPFFGREICHGGAEAAAAKHGDFEGHGFWGNRRRVGTSVATVGAVKNQVWIFNRFFDDIGK